MKKLVTWWDKQPVKFGLVGLVAVAIGAYGWLSNGPTVGVSDCAQHPLRHVYHAQRLHVVAKCQQITFRVVAWRREHDNDVHVDGVVTSGGQWIDAANIRGQHGLTVVEFVPGDPRPPKFYANQVLELTVTKVTDEQHKRKDEAQGWFEAHPVEAEQDVTPVGVRAGPNRPGLVSREDDPRR